MICFEIQDDCYVGKLGNFSCSNICGTGERQYRILSKYDDDWIYFL